HVEFNQSGGRPLVKVFNPREARDLFLMFAEVRLQVEQLTRPELYIFWRLIPEGLFCRLRRGVGWNLIVSAREWIFDRRWRIAQCDRATTLAAKESLESMSSLPVKTSQRLLLLILILALAFAVRALTANFLRAHLHDPGWFPSGIYRIFDQQAQNWLDGRTSIFLIDDPSRTDAAIYPPGYPLWLALLYKLSGSRSPFVVQNVQWVLDALSVVLIVGLGVTAFDWPIGLIAGSIAALWPLLAIYGSVPLADAPTSWLIISATWMLLLAAKRTSYRWAVAAGALMGASCWFRANALFLAFFCGAAILLFVDASWRRRLLLSAALVVASMLMI